MTLDQCRKKVESELRELYPDGECRWMTRIIFEQLKGYTPVEMAIRANEPVSDFIQQKIDCIVSRLLKYEPIQYVFGETRFYGLSLKVTPATLIPRPETEELVDMIVADAAGHSDLRVLDLCTGSGCIAIALARNLRFPAITAIDISKDAIAVARDNAASTHTDIHFFTADALRLNPTSESYDIIVSNPPYIAEHERTQMEPNVLDYEPGSALFVPDDDPLKFYRAISLFAMPSLRKDGRLYFEINPIYASELTEMLCRQGWNNILTHRDAQGKQRFISATK